MRGVLLAGGTGSRLWPVTLAVSKQLLPVYDKPMIFYPLSVLIQSGVTEILIITRPDERRPFRRLLGDGGQWGLRITYAIQEHPRGVAEALLIAADHLDGGPGTLILGDNIFHGPALADQLRPPPELDGALVFATAVNDPSAYGIVEFDEAGAVRSIEEKPVVPRSRYAVPGLYFYDAEAVKVAANLAPGPRGELEISDVNADYLSRGRLAARVLSPETTWLDAGTVGGLARAGEYVRIRAERDGVRIGCPEEAAWRGGLIGDDALRRLARPLRASGYGEYLLTLLDP